MAKHPNRRPAQGFTLGRAAFDQISAVEGLHRDGASEAMFAEFDRCGFSADARREMIRARHGANSATATSPAKRPGARG